MLRANVAEEHIPKLERLMFDITFGNINRDFLFLFLSNYTLELVITCLEL